MLRVPYEVMDTQHETMRRAAREIDVTLDTIRDALQRLHWQGADRAAYNDAQKRWDDSVVDMNNVLNEIAMAVGYARENYATTEMSNSQLWSN
jgi:early secretory antigenic target protein ESAT-6